MTKSRKTILVVDDDRGIVRLLEKKLGDDGYDVISAITGTTGLERAKKEQPDLLLLDIMIPDMSGIQLGKAILADEETKDIPIIYMTACMGVENDKGDETIDIDGTLFRAFAKPLHNPKLMSTIRKEINKARNKNN